MEAGGGGKHFVRVRVLCLGAWSWYKVATALESAGHRVTALDLAASGAHPARLHEVRSFEDYSRPLLDAVAAAPDGDRLVLVGHNLALAMERFPRKVAAAVFVAAALPCVGKHMGVIIKEVHKHTHMHQPLFQVSCHSHKYICKFDFFFFFCDEGSS